MFSTSIPKGTLSNVLKAKVVMSPVEFSSVGHFVSKTPPRDDGSLNVNLRMFGER